jgi:DNA (cytosine-5)-methyltransferase 1
LIEDALIPIVDLFAGPGGLNEGFCSALDINGKRVFDSVASFEMNALACRTLRLRSTFRALRANGGDLGPYYKYISGQVTWNETLSGKFREAYESTAEHIFQVELGEEQRKEVDAIILEKLGPHESRGHWILIGGPPCQAYSLAGRSRRTSDENFESDHKHFLYKEYLHILDAFQPSIFVMENVKGLLSSTHGGKGMFLRILDDLRKLPGGVRYEIRSLVVDVDHEDVQPEDFIIRAEEHGLPQKRHRVILLGVRSDLAHRIPRRVLDLSPKPVTVRDAIGGLPARVSVASGRLPKRALNWEEELSVATADAKLAADPRSDMADVDNQAAKDLREWLEDDNITAPVHHVPRSHMISDLVRYRVMATKALELGRSPKYADLHESLQPDHNNIGQANTPFTDRFRVQVWDQPSTTVVSHISKDGHYYIHPDPIQGRSLTVREAARLQTFPDNYFFEGARTQQFHQVGNAVPPLLARKIADKVALMLGSLFDGPVG